AGAVARDALEQSARQEAERTRQLLARAEGAALVAVVGELDADPAREGQGGRHRDRILALRPAAPRGYPLRPRRRRMPERIAGIQPGYLPWLGYFDQMLRVDAFLVADELQFTTSGWAHRNRVKAPEGARWLTLPARRRSGAAIAEVRLDPATRWARRHLATLRH